MPDALNRRVANAVDWTFRNRRTGRITIAQVPNVPLSVFLAATGIRILASPHGGVRTAIDAIASVALFWWAADEIVRGVNPFRRLLGAAVLLVAVYARFG